jgi:hypothetical protein
MPSATADVVPPPSAASTLTVMIRARNATPTTPRPFAAAAMIPATWVPCPLPSERSCAALAVVRSTPWTSST